MRQVYLGVDFHATKTVTHRIKRTSKGNLMRTNASYYLEELPRLVKTLDQQTYVCIEASEGVFELCERIRPLVKDVIVIHPLAFQKMYLAGKKNGQGRR